MDLSFLSLLFLTLAGFAAGFIDSMVGGGGLLAMPALLLTGMPPAIALGTNKLQGSFGTLTSTISYARAGLIKKDHILIGIITTAVGAATGSYLVQHLDATILKYLIPTLLSTLFIFMLVKKDIGVSQSKTRINLVSYYLFVGLLMGFYDGFFGPGTGAFHIIFFILLAGFTLKEATAQTKVLNFTSNIVALAIFINADNVAIIAGLCMGGAQVLGARLGSLIVIHKNTRLIRRIFLGVVGVTIIKLIYDLL